MIIQENKLQSIESVLAIFNWAALKLVPSSHELEPIDDRNVIFTGSFSVQNTKSVKIKGKADKWALPLIFIVFHYEKL